MLKLKLLFEVTESQDVGTQADLPTEVAEDTEVQTNTLRREVENVEVQNNSLVVGDVETQTNTLRREVKDVVQAPSDSTPQTPSEALSLPQATSDSLTDSLTDVLRRKHFFGP